MRFRNSEEISIFKRFYLRSETVSEEKSQGKNDFFGALRAATTAGRRKKQEEKFFDSRIVGPKAAERCFSSKVEVKTRRAERAQNFWGVFHASEASMLSKGGKEVQKVCTLGKKKSSQKCALWRKKNTDPTTTLPSTFGDTVKNAHRD